MSIACPMFDAEVSSLDQVRAERTRAKRPVSVKRVEANRRNARRSTGPRTVAGKARASRNALKHGLCSTYSHLPSEEAASFETFLSELEGEMRPRTVLQRHLFPQIANLLWRIRRLPEAESALFVRESGKAAVDETETLPVSEVLARRFSDEPSSNGFLLMGRYERGMQNALMRMIRQFHALQKSHAMTPYADGDGRCPREGSQPAWSEEKARAQREHFAREQAKLTETVRHASDARERHVREDAIAFEKEYGVPLYDAPAGNAREAEERTQTKPPENVDSGALAEECPTSSLARVAERTHCGADDRTDGSGAESAPQAGRLNGGGCDK